MGLTGSQRNAVRKFVREQGVTFEPLLDEMVDHLSCEVEERIIQGFPFDEAWQQSINEIPQNHFLNIQQETMQSITKRFNLSQSLSYTALALLLCSTIFKIFHLQFAGELLLLSFVFIGVPLVLNALSGINHNKEKKGIMLVMGVITGVIILMFGYGFKILHLPGADAIIVVAVIAVVASLLANTWLLYVQSNFGANLLTFLHEKYTPGIERFFLFLLLPITIYKIVSLMQIEVEFVGSIILLVVMYGAALQFIALNWRVMEADPHKRNGLPIAGIALACVCFNLPFLGPILPFEVRVAVIVLFTAASAILAYYTDAQSSKLIALLMAILVPVVFVGSMLIKLSLIPVSAGRIFFNVPVLLVLIAGLLLCRKNSIMRTYMLIALSSYLFEYQTA